MPCQSAAKYDVFVLDKIVEFGGKVVDKIWPSAEKKLEADMARQSQQTSVNVEQAKSASIFIAGPRPFVMWIGGIALAYTFLIVPIIQYVAKVMGWPQPDLPVLDARLFQILIGLLGLG